ncbi:MAG: type II toxin-antitoxin system RelE/ParE family toxin [Chitinispirillales bacterium]|jgi:plasmid stabilization system protein ParE|nr:type II toxin-antitoxin system RelE/ParE family toxin [Chitinispirillales bacterium]
MTYYKIKQLPKAIYDSLEIYEYLSQFYVSTPKKFLNEFHGKLKKLSFSPEIYKKWPDNPIYRMFNVRRYLVFYKVDHDTKTIFIHRILNGMRDFMADIELMEKQEFYNHKI